MWDLAIGRVVSYRNNELIFKNIYILVNLSFYMSIMVSEHKFLHNGSQL